jgi:hypothetical protein
MQRKKYRFAGLLAVTVIGMESLFAPLWGTENHGQDMIAVLKAAGPHPSLGDQAQTFDRFVGTWDCDYAEFKDDGTTKRTRGQVIFGWILDGRAVQDVWISLAKNGEREIGTTIRFFDPKTEKWRIVWVDPTSHVIDTLSGGAIDGRIILEGIADDGSLLRWSFNEIRNDSFVWRGEKTRDKGGTWRLTGEYHLKRRGAPELENVSSLVRSSAAEKHLHSPAAPDHACQRSAQETRSVVRR